MHRANRPCRSCCWQATFQIFFHCFTLLFRSASATLIASRSAFSLALSAAALSSARVLLGFLRGFLADTTGPLALAFLLDTTGVTGSQLLSSGVAERFRFYPFAAKGDASTSFSNDLASALVATVEEGGVSNWVSGFGEAGSPLTKGGDASVAILESRRRSNILNGCKRGLLIEGVMKQLNEINKKSLRSVRKNMLSIF